MAGKKKIRRHFRHRVVAWDHFWMHRSGKVQLPPWLHRLLIAFVRSGDGWGWIFVMLALWLFLPWARVRFLLVQALIALSISLPLYWLLKLTIRRARPFTLFKSITARVPPLDTYSFPSGHTMNNMAVAACMALHLHWLWWLALIVPVSLGLLRVLYGVHFVSDIVGGAVIGLGVALLAYGVSGWLPALASFF